MYGHADEASAVPEQTRGDAFLPRAHRGGKPGKTVHMRTSFLSPPPTTPVCIFPTTTQDSHARQPWPFPIYCPPKMCLSPFLPGQWTPLVHLFTNLQLT